MTIMIFLVFSADETKLKIVSEIKLPFAIRPKVVVVKIKQASAKIMGKFTIFSRIKLCLLINSNLSG